MSDSAPRLLAEARGSGATELSEVLAGEIEVRLFVARGAGIEEIWLAVSLRDVEGRGVPARVRDMIFAIFERTVGQAEWEWRADRPGGELRWFEVARLGVREA